MAIATRSMAIGVFASRADAEQAVRDLLGAAFEPDQLGIVLPDAAARAATEAETWPTALWAGASFRSLVGAEIPASERRCYEKALEDGSPLVIVRAGDRYSESMDIINRCGGEYTAAFVGIFTGLPDVGPSLPLFWFWQRKPSDSAGGTQGHLTREANSRALGSSR
jgi:hypothetical protein